MCCWPAARTPPKRDARVRRAAHARAGGHPCFAKRLDTVVDKDEAIW